MMIELFRGPADRFDIGRESGSSKRTPRRGFPGAVGGAIRAGQNHRVTIEVTQPDLPVIGAAVAR